MTEVIKAVKSLLGLQDLAIGRGKFQQKRGTATVYVDKIELPIIIPTSDTYDINLIDTTKFNVLLVLGKVSENDGKGGIFIYDPVDTSSIASDDVLVGITSNKRFKRLRMTI